MTTAITVEALKASDRTTKISGKSQVITITAVEAKCSAPTQTVTTATNAASKVYLTGAAAFTDSTALANTWTFAAFTPS